jgi:hypothetical protein
LLHLSSSGDLKSVHPKWCVHNPSLISSQIPLETKDHPCFAAKALGRTRKSLRDREMRGYGVHGIPERFHVPGSWQASCFSGRRSLRDAAKVIAAKDPGRIKSRRRNIAARMRS